MDSFWLVISIIAAATVSGLVGYLITHYLPAPGKRILALIVLIVFIIVFAIVAAVTSDSGRVISPQPSAQILSHSDKDEILQEENFSGTYANIPGSSELWLYVFSPEKGRYSFDVAARFNDKTWESREVQIGYPDGTDDGKVFEVGLLLAENDTNNLLREQASGTEKIPQGVEILDKITVYRAIGDLPQPTSTSTSEVTPSITPLPEEATNTPTPSREPILESTSTPTVSVEPTQPLVVNPRLLSPEHDIYQSPIAFEWEYVPNTEYQVTLQHSERSIVHKSEWIQGSSWTFDIPSDQYGNWEWFVTSEHGGVSEIGTFVFNPFPNSGPNYPTGDLNHDCVVNDADGDILQQHFLEEGPPGWIEADLNRDGIITTADYSILRGNVGKTCP